MSEPTKSSHNLLKRIFRIFPDRQNKYLYVKKNKTILREGDESNFVYIIEKGSALVTKSCGEGGKITIKTLKENDIIGELSLIGGGQCAATVTAVEDCKLLKLITPHKFNTLYKENPEALIPLLKILAKRLRATLNLI